MFRLMAVLFCASLLFAGCIGTPAAPADYFPYQPGMTATYAGEGNEYASFTIDVLYREDGKLEWRLNNGGTVMAEVLRLDADAVVLVYREGEAYDQAKRLIQPSNWDETLLKAPIKVGTTWTAGDATYKITSTTETVQAAGTTLTSVVVVEATWPNSTIRRYYHKQYGLVLSVFESEGSVVESRLQSLTTP